ncbi:MAG: trimethylamine methyltransferase family protein [Candidatus Adiutrix sp.]|jgi:trimethylamine:corrinoid methyltransferase-like protein|nr:trimethylamine methyltransferase family protein [Candidatus Adiutrix sp.]
MVALFSYFSDSETETMKEQVFRLLAEDGVKLDSHPQLIPALTKAGYQMDEASGILKIPVDRMKAALEEAPKSFKLGARNPERILQLPKPGGGFWARTCTGGHAWLEPDGSYRRVTLNDVAKWSQLSNALDEISFLSFLFADDAPVYSADVHSMVSVVNNTDKHLWVQPYEAKNVDYLVKLGEAVAGGAAKLKENPVISFIACSLTPRLFKHMDLEIIYKSALAGTPIQACSLPGAGATSPITVPGVVILATAEILAMTAMAQAVQPGTPVVACPIIFSSDMRSGRSLQSSAEAIKAGSACVQFIKKAFALPTHNYGLGSDAAGLGEQNMAERTMLLTAKALSGQDIMGGAGQTEVAVCVSPLQLIADNELLSMARVLVSPIELNDNSMATAVLKKVEPGKEFISQSHTVKNCRNLLPQKNFNRMTMTAWKDAGEPDLQAALRADYEKIMAAPNTGAASADLTRELDEIVKAADAALKEAAGK